MLPHARLILLAALVVLVGGMTAYGQPAGRSGKSLGVQSAGQSSGKGGQARSAGQSAQARGVKSTAKTGSGTARQNAANAKQRASGQNNATPRAKNATTPAKGSSGAGASAGTKSATRARASKGAVDSGGAVTSNQGGTVKRGNTAAGSYGRGYGRYRSHRGHYSAYSNPPRGAPALAVDPSHPLTHVLTFAGKQHRGHGDALPHGVTGIEVWGKVDGPAPTDPSELTRGAVANGNSYTVTFDANQPGTTAHYAVRYVNSQGAGPFSKIVSATVKR